MQAGLIRRGTALYLDLLVAVFPALLLIFLPALFLPLDRIVGWLIVLTIPVIVAALAYVFGGPALFPNTYGRYAMGVRVVDHHTGGRPDKRQVFVRMLTTGLWPVEAVLIAVSPTRRRLGDRWAHTSVVRYDPGASWGRRMLPALGVVAAALCLHLLQPVISGRMDISRAAAAYVWQQRAVEPVGAPGQVLVMNDSGSVGLRLAGGRYARVHLVREGGRWRGTGIEDIPRDALGRGFSVQRGTGSVSGP